jgi:NTE family protein
MAGVTGNRRVGLALGGGGSRGFAHIGVLKVLEEESITVDVIAGTSIGAVIGGAFASGLGPAELVEKVEEIVRSPLARLPVFQTLEETDKQQKELRLADKVGLFFKSQWLFAQALFKPGMMEGEDFQAVVNHFIPDIRIEDTKIPFRAVAADLISGNEVVMSKGSLRCAVMASCAVPGFMPPIKDGEMLLVDGGIINMVPCSVVRGEGAQVVIAVDVDRDIGADSDFKNAIDVYIRASEISNFHLSYFRLKDADVTLRPRVGNIKWFDISQSSGIISEGERCAREGMERVRKLIPEKKERKLLSVLRALFSKRA